MGNWRLVGMLFVVAVVLGGLGYWQSQTGNGGGAAVEATPTIATAEPLLDGVTLENVVRVEVGDEAAGLTLVYEQDNQLWLQTQPVEQNVTEIFPAALSPLLTAVSEQQIAAEGNRLSVYGLENPAYAVVVAVQRPDGQIGRMVLAIGDLTPTGTAYYVQKSGDGRVYVVSQGAFEGLLNLLRLG